MPHRRTCARSSLAEQRRSQTGPGESFPSRRGQKENSLLGKSPIESPAMDLKPRVAAHGT
jgi:hypothetical protein